VQVQLKRTPIISAEFLAWFIFFLFFFLRWKKKRKNERCKKFS